MPFLTKIALISSLKWRKNDTTAENNRFRHGDADMA